MIVTRCICAHPGCFRSGTWIDSDDGRGYCGEHIICVAPAPEDVTAEKRRDNGAEWLHDAARGEP